MENENKDFPLTAPKSYGFAQESKPTTQESLSDTPKKDWKLSKSITYILILLILLTFSFLGFWFHQKSILKKWRKSSMINKFLVFSGTFVVNCIIRVQYKSNYSWLVGHIMLDFVLCPIPLSYSEQSLEPFYIDGYNPLALYNTP